MSRVQRFSPFGPLFDKELRVAARRKRNYVLRVFYLGALLMILLMAYAAMSEYGTGVTERVQRQSELGHTFFVCFAIFSVVAMGVIGPVLTSTAIGSERLAKTLHVLLMTPLNTWQIIGGKLFSRLLLALMLVGLSLPVLALVRLLGGVEIWQVSAAIVLATTTALFSAAVGLWLSSMVNRAFAVILLSYGVLGIVYLFIPFCILMIAHAGGMNPNRLMFVLGAVNPVWGVAFGVLGVAPMSMRIAWLPCALLHAAAAALLVALTAWTLRRQQRREGMEYVAAAPTNAVPPALPSATLPAGDERGETAPVVPAAPIRRALREVGDNPIRWRELRQPIIARRWQRILARVFFFGVLAAIYLLTGIEGGLDEQEVHAMFGVMFNSIFWLVAAVIAATLIATEHESDTWTLLLVTPLAAHNIVWGKLIGLFWRLRWLAAIIIAHFAVVTICGVLSWQTSFVTVLMILSMNALWMATGVYLSLRISNVTFAVVVNLLLGVVLYGGVPLIEAVIHELVRSGSWDGPVTLLLDPYYYIVQGIDRLGDFSRYQQVKLVGFGRVSAATWLTVTSLVAVGHLLVAWGMIQWTIVRFDKIVGRAAQIEAMPASQPVAG